VNAFGDKDVPESDFAVGGGLKSASLLTSLGLYDQFSNTTSPANINVTWTAAGQAHPDYSARHYATDDGEIVYRPDGVARDANAIGSFTYQSWTVNYPAYDALEAVLRHDAHGTITVYQH
jgi:hypothetical protein